jgi:hypothetical protein
MTTTGDDPPPGHHSVTARYLGMEAARRAVERLEEHGVAASSIRLLGAAAEQADRATATGARDDRLMAFAVRSVVTGMLLGGVAGAVLAGGAGLWWFGLAGLGLAGAALAGAVGGAYMGFMLGGVAKVKQSEAWELTYQDAPEDFSEVGVGVRTADAAEADRAERALRQTDPVTIERD